jgi:hypothetical protein
MASKAPILAIDEDVDDQIVEFCRPRHGIEPADVIRDIARIVCIVNMVRVGAIDGKNMALRGGMAMRCLDSPRMSIYDSDTASNRRPDVAGLPEMISHDEEDMEIVAGPWDSGNKLITFRPVTFDARFSQLAGAQSEFSLSVAHRGIEARPVTRKLNHRYPFPVLAGEVSVPIMHPDEILAEKIVAWLLFGHAKHYNDIAFLSGRLMSQGRSDQDPETRATVRRYVDRKLEVNTEISAAMARRVKALDTAERRRRLEEPDSHVDPKRTFDTLSYLHGSPPTRAGVKGLVQRILVPLLFD